MGSDYAKDTLAGQIAAKIQSLVGDAPFAKAHPTVAAALSGGIDNAMQAFVESYADKAIDAALGDEKAAQSLFTTDTLIAALESGLSGGASGAMGGCCRLRSGEVQRRQRQPTGTGGVLRSARQVREGRGGGEETAAAGGRAGNGE